jgi:hypothetical protein
MTEQPQPSAEALKLGGYASSYEMVMKLAVEIDALCEQRVSAETERCAKIAFAVMDEELPEPYWDNARARRMDWTSCAGRIMALIRAPAERPAVVDYTERARLFANQTYTGPDSYARYRKALADEFAAVASEHQAAHVAEVEQAYRVGKTFGRVETRAALLARLREPEMREAVARGMALKSYTGSYQLADAALAVITEKLNG